MTLCTQGLKKHGNILYIGIHFFSIPDVKLILNWYFGCITKIIVKLKSNVNTLCVLMAYKEIHNTQRKRYT